MRKYSINYNIKYNNIISYLIMSDNILDETILKTQALNFLHEFISDIISVFPEYKELIFEHYHLFMSDDKEDKEDSKKNDIVMEFINNLSKYNKKITDKDESLFSQDIYLLNKVNFKDIWCSKISDETRGKIWNYLQTFSMLSITINSNKDLGKIMNSLNNIVKGESTDTENNELNDVINNLKKLSTSLTNEDDVCEEETDKNGGMEDTFNSFFSGSKIGDLAKEIAGDLNVEKMVEENKGKPEDLLKNIFSGSSDGKDGGFNIMNVVENISGKIHKKISDGDINEEDLMREAKNMMSSMQGNSLFGNLFNSSATSESGGDAGVPDISGMLNMLGGGGVGGADGGMPDISGMLNMLGDGGEESQDKDINSILGLGDSPRKPEKKTVGVSSNRNVAARQRLQKKLKAKKSKEP